MPSHDYRLHVRRSGHGQPLILIHGVAGSGVIWDQMAPYLEQSFEIIRIDLLGYGHSPKPRHFKYTPAAHVAAIRSTLQKLGLPPPYNLIGLSMGSLLAITYAELYPAEVVKVVGLGLPYYQSADQARRDLRVNFWTRLVLDYPLLARIVIGVFWRIAPRSKYMLRTFTPKIYTPLQSKESMYARYRSFAGSLLECMVNYRIEPVLDAIHQTPILLIQGSADQWSPLARIRGLVDGRTNVQLKVLNGYEHNIAVLAPEQAAQAIKGYI